MYVVYFDQRLGAGRTQKLVETFFQPFFNLFCSFQSFFSDFTAKITKKCLKNVSTSFWVHAAPKYWSKYTTNVICLGKKLIYIKKYYLS